VQELLLLKNIYKSFEGVHALQGVDFSIYPGEIHCLVGENGSGKSTLIKIISGVYQPDSGEITVENDKMDHIGSAESIAKGIQVIYQDLSLFPNLTVAENIAISELKEEGKLIINWNEVLTIAKAATEYINVDLDLSAKVEELPIGIQQLVAICRAFTKEVRLLILDEPTASLTKKDIESLLSVVRDLQSRGIAILFVSHKLNEIFEVAERITVLRDGYNVGTLPREELDNKKLVSLMTGKTIIPKRFQYTGKGKRKLLEVRKLNKKYNFKDISFDLYEGEIISITGLVGSGRTELALALFGISPADSGEISIDGKITDIQSVQNAVDAGISYMPENRLTQGVILKKSVGENIITPILRSLLNRFKLIDYEKWEAIVEKWITALNIRVSDSSVMVETLSGGNQQRVVIAKWLASKPKILILDGPTVGIDVMAKNSIHGIIHDLANEGIGVLLISDEAAEVVNNSNRILIMRSGKIYSELRTADVTEEEVQKIVEAKK
jgi:simple sugar transport system ATP-binding protein